MSSHKNHIEEFEKSLEIDKPTRSLLAKRRNARRMFNLEEGDRIIETSEETLSHGFKSIKENYKEELEEKDRIIENLKEEIKSQWLTNKTAFNTKKLYEEYLPGFRKGRGHNNLIKLYWLFALVLCIYYAQTNQIKYLNTIIKVCDLITSLSLQDLTKHIPKFGLDLVLSSEMIFIQILLKDKGIKYENEWK